MKKSKIFFYSCLFFFLGIFIFSFWTNLKTFTFHFFVLFSISLLIFYLFFEKKRTRIFFFFLAFFFLGAWRVLVAIPDNGPDKIWFYNGEKLKFRASIVSEIDERISGQKFEVRADKYQGKVLVTTNLYPDYYYGDVLDIECNLKQPEKIEDFSYDKYLARYHIYSLCYYPAIEVVGFKEDTITLFYTKIFSLKVFFRDLINNNLSEPEAGLASAMTMGYKRGIEQSLKDNFAQTGISHIAAISGLHISILVLIVFNFFLYSGLKRSSSFYLTSLILFFYIVMIGMPASALRAGLMGFLVIFAMHIGRLNSLKHSLIIVAFALLMINPKLLVFDIGFQLSFLAVLGIAYIFPYLQNKSGKTGAVWDIIWVSLSAQIATMPVVVYNFKILSIISPLANLLVIWTLPAIIISVFSALFLSLLLPSVSTVFFLPAYLLLKYVVLVAVFLANFTFASISF